MIKGQGYPLPLLLKKKEGEQEGIKSTAAAVFFAW
jgi:hypothetical protein